MLYAPSSRFYFLRIFHTVSLVQNTTTKSDYPWEKLPNFPEKKTSHHAGSEEQDPKREREEGKFN